MKNIYIFCPQNYKSGGPELLHQLSDSLIRRGANAHLVYTGKKEDYIPIKEYEKYKTNYIFENEIIDSSDSFVIVPEVMTFLLKKIHFSKKIIWWMSVDNYTKDFFSFSFIQNNGFSSMIKNLLASFKHYLKNKEIGIPPFLLFKDRNILHLSQCAYITNYLRKSGVDDFHLFVLQDYVSDDFLNKKYLPKKRKNIVLFNPKKGYKFTKKIISKMKDIQFIPLSGMSNDELERIMLSAKLYIDFGSHPGMDRLPREAAYLGCCVITDRCGSANFYEDVPISDQYKFFKRKRNLKNICKKIRYTVENYDKAINDFSFYREKISLQKRLFEKQVDDLYTKFLN